MFQQVLDFTDEGRALKAAGISRVESHTPDDYKEKFKQTVLNLPVGHLFTSDDVLAAVGLPPNHLNAVGALMSGLAKSNMIEKVSYVQSKRESRHAAEIKLWRRI